METFYNSIYRPIATKFVYLMNSMKSGINRVLCVCLGLTITLFACKRDASTGWDTGILAPLATANLTLQNLVKDTILHTNSDSSLSLSYQSTVYELNLAISSYTFPIPL
jgi:hypothetical protein